MMVGTYWKNSCKSDLSIERIIGLDCLQVAEEVTRGGAL
jgi:hypothetical protein